MDSKKAKRYRRDEKEKGEIKITLMRIRKEIKINS